jgi:succinoglycan biosynthesis transport protein ExoP
MCRFRPLRKFASTSNSILKAANRPLAASLPAYIMSKDFELLRRIGHARRAGTNGSLHEIPREPHPNPRITEHQVPPLTDGSSVQDAGWVKALSILRKRWRFAASVALVITAIAALVIFLMKPEYEPIARIEIDPPGTETFSMQTTAALGSESQYLETQAQNMQTDDLAIFVIRKLGLDRNPDFAKSAHQDNGTSQQGALTAAENEALLALRSRLRVIHDPNSHILSLSVIAHDPRLAADVTNAMAHAFVERTINMRRDTINSSRAFLQNQLEEVRLKAEQANRDLAAFEKQTGVADIDEGRNSFGDMMTELNRQATQIGAERIQLESYLQKAQEGGLDSLPQVRENPVVQKLTQNLAEVQSQLSQNKVIYGVNHPNTKKLRNQELELEKQLNIQKKEALDQLRLSYNAARAREKLMAAQKKKRRTGCLPAWLSTTS